MTGFTKGIIISLVLLVIIMAAGVAAGIYWLSTHGGQFLEKSKQSMLEGEQFGKATDNQGCLAESIVRHKQTPGFSSALSTQLFLQGCLQASRATPGFCDDVPKRLEFVKSAQWQQQQCARNNLRDTYCPQLFSQVETFCERHRPTE
jgi:hypothetical protein